jgi:large subunit ribosomal protein L6
MVKIPDGIEVRVEPASITVKGPTGQLSHSYNPLYCQVRVEGKELLVEVKGRACRKNRAVVGAVEAHARNLIAGVQGNFEKKLTMVFAHFPISIEVKGKDVAIKNFLGEKLPRKAKILGEGTKVAVQGQDITVTGPDRYAVGQTASNLVKAARPHNKDIRVFQDGIYPVRK